MSPAENQQTVEALAEIIRYQAKCSLMRHKVRLVWRGEDRGMYQVEVHEPDGCGMCAFDAALRDLVAKAELAAEMSDGLRFHGHDGARGAKNGCPYCALLARLDGAGE